MSSSQRARRGGGSSSQPNKRPRASQIDGLDLFQARSSRSIDEELYSRQLYVYGKEAMTKIFASKILISGIGGLGVEIAKNVILGGAETVTLQDVKKTTWPDLTSQFFLKESDLGRNRAEASRLELAELSPSVRVNVNTEPLSIAYLMGNGFKVVVLTEGSAQLVSAEGALESLMEFCHNRGIFVILTETRGLFSRIFCDFGKKFEVVDDIAPATAEIGLITNELQGIVITLRHSPHGLKDGDYVTFKDINGMTQLNGIAPVKIEVIGPYTFRIPQNTSGFSTYISGGKVTQVKASKKLEFKPFKESQLAPEFVLTDSTKSERLKMK